MFVTADCYKAAIASIEKCASQSIHLAVSPMKGAIILSNEEALEYETRVMFVRHPIERLISCYSHLSWLTHNDYQYDEIMPIGIMDGKGDLAEYRRFIDYILKNNDPHWDSQYDLMLYNHSFVPNKVHKFDDIGSLWGLYAAGMLPHINAWTDRQYNHYRLDELLFKYSKDLELWENA